jgi:copper chaperone NosL
MVAVKLLTTMRLRRLVLALAAPLVLAACATGPEPVHWGVESCAHCQMVISDDRFAGQVVDTRGKTYKFDAIECMAAFLKDDIVAAAEVKSVWVADGPDGWIEAGAATFVHSDNVRTPMGGGFSAHADAVSAGAFAAEVEGRVLTWEDVLARASSHDHGLHQGH